MSKFTVPDNGLAGLLRGVTVDIAGKTFEITVLNMESARKAWVLVQRWLVGAELAATLNEELSGTEHRTGVVEMVGQMGQLTDCELEDLTKLFAPKTRFRVSVTQADGAVREDIRALHESGAMDQAFGGDISSFLDWLNYCVMLNFGKQIEKHVAALGASKKAADAAKAVPTPNAAG